MLTILLSIFRYIFLLVLFSFVYRVVSLIRQDMHYQSKNDFKDEKLFYAPLENEYPCQGRLENLEEDYHFNLIVPITTIGRSNHNHVIINDDYSSYEHARIVFQQEKFYLEDLQSTNGTYINGVRISQRIELHDGDQLKIGQTIFVFRR